MAILKGFILILVVVPIFSALHFITGLYLGEDDFIFTSLMVFLSCLTLFVLGIVGLIKPIKYILNKRSRNTVAIITSILLLISTAMILLVFIGIYEIDRMITGEEKPQLSMEEKLNYMKESYIKLTGQEYDLDSMNNKEVGNITFYYEKEYNPDRVIDLTIETLKSYESEIDVLFGELEPQPVKIILYNDYNKFSSYIEPIPGRRWGGFYNPGSRIIHLNILPVGQMDEQLLKRTIIHEYAHHLLSSYVDEHNLNYIPPDWFNEGLAAYIERKDLITKEEEFMDVEFVRFSNLDSQSEWNDHLRSPYDPYLQSYLFINYLIEEHGNGVISSILMNSKGKSFLEGFEIGVGEKLEKYEVPFIDKLGSVEKLFQSVPRKLHKENDPQGALDTLFEIVSIVPNHDLANHNIANIYFGRGEYEEALQFRQKGVNLQPDYAPSYSYLASTLLFFDIEEALAAESRGLELAKKYKEGTVFVQSRIDDLNEIVESISDGNPYKGYLTFIKEDNKWNLNDQNKVDLIKHVLNQYPEIETKEKRELISIMEKLEKAL